MTAFFFGRINDCRALKTQRLKLQIGQATPQPFSGPKPETVQPPGTEKYLNRNKRGGIKRGGHRFRHLLFLQRVCLEMEQQGPHKNHAASPGIKLIISSEPAS